MINLWKYSLIENTPQSPNCNDFTMLELGIEGPDSPGKIKSQWRKAKRPPKGKT